MHCGLESTSRVKCNAWQKIRKDKSKITRRKIRRKQLASILPRLGHAELLSQNPHKLANIIKTHYFKFRIFGNIKPSIMQVNNILTTLIKIPDKLFLLVTIETLLEILAFFCHSSFSRPSCQENPLKANPFRSTGSNNTKKKTSFFSFRLDSNSYSLVIVPCPVSSCTWRPIYVNIIIFAPSIKANFLHLCNTKPSFII